MFTTDLFGFQNFMRGLERTGATLGWLTRPGLDWNQDSHHYVVCISLTQMNLHKQAPEVHLVVMMLFKTSQRG